MIKVIYTTHTFKFIYLRIFIDKNLVPQALIYNNPLKKILLTTISTLLMNQMEIVFFSFYLEYIMWDDTIKLEDNLLLTGLYTKVRI